MGEFRDNVAGYLFQPIKHLVICACGVRKHDRIYIPEAQIRGWFEFKSRRAHQIYSRVWTWRALSKLVNVGSIPATRANLLAQ